MGDSPCDVERLGQWALLHAGRVQQPQQRGGRVQVTVAEFRSALQYQSGAHRPVLPRGLVHPAAQHAGL